MTDTYQQQLTAKAQTLTELFADLPMPKWEIYPSPSEHHRMRAEFRIWHEGEHISYAMFQSGQSASSQSLIKLEQYPPASKRINELMPKLINAISQQPILKERWFQCDFLTTLSGDALITLVYHKPLTPEWQVAAEALQQQLGVAIIGRSRKQKITLSRDYVTETLNIEGKAYHYRQSEGSFSQPNAQICCQMLTWASQIAKQINPTPSNSLLELYCGNGNFTLPLSQHFRHVIATEISKTATADAHWNITTNHTHNIQIVRLSAEEFTQAYQQTRPFRRLIEQNIDLTQHQFSTVFVDPPRAGIDEQTLSLLQHFPNILYISCNPHTLHNNLHTLCQSHQPIRAALFDQFPHTPHIESGVWLRKKA